MSFAHALPVHLRRRREKVFGDGRPRPLDRNAKVRVMHLARALSRRTEKGKALRGAVTAKALAVLEALLWGFQVGRLNPPRRAQGPPLHAQPRSPRASSRRALGRGQVVL